MGVAPAGGLAAGWPAELAGGALGRFCAAAGTHSKTSTIHTRFILIPLLAADSRDELLCDGKGAAHAEGLGGNLQARRRLLALIFIAVHAERHLAYQLEAESIVVGNLLRAAQIFDVGL